MQAKCRKQWSYFKKSTSNLWNKFVSVSWGSWMYLPWLWHLERPGVHMNKSFNAVVNPMSLWGIALVILMKDVRLKGWEAELVWIPSPVLGMSPTQGKAEIAITVDICLQSVQQSAHYLLECCGFGAWEIYGKDQMRGHYFNKGKVASQTLWLSWK